MRATGRAPERGGEISSCVERRGSRRERSTGRRASSPGRRARRAVSPAPGTTRRARDARAAPRARCSRRARRLEEPARVRRTKCVAGKRFGYLYETDASYERARSRARAPMHEREGAMEKRRYSAQGVPAMWSVYGHTRRVPGSASQSDGFRSVDECRSASCASRIK